MDTRDQIRDRIERAIPGARVEVTAAEGGHFSIVVTAAAFAGLSLLEKQRLVYGAIADLMRGDNPPVHAVDQLVTRTV